MHALLEQTVKGARRFYVAAGSRVSGWSVLPLRQRDAERSHRRLGIGNSDAVDGPDGLLPSPDREEPRLLGEWLAPVEEPVAEIGTTAADAVAEDGVAWDVDAVAEPAGDLVALGTLVCLLTIIFSLSALAGLARLIL